MPTVSSVPRPHLLATLALLLAGALPGAATASTASTPVPDLVTSQGCGQAAEPGRQTLAVGSGGLTYSVPVAVPQGYDPATPTPLVVALHGATQSGTSMMDETELDLAADRHGFLLASPDGGIPHVPAPVNLYFGYFWHVPGSPMVGGGPVPPGSRDDEQFLLDLAQAMADRFCVDLSRRYLTGASNGGFMTSFMACHRGDVFAAVAPVMGVQAGRPDDEDPTQPDPGTCRPSRPIPLLAVHGREDPIVPYEGDADSPGVEAAMRRWAVINGCARTSRSRAMTGTVTRVTWRRCSAPTVLVRSEIGGHAWHGHPPLPPFDLVAGTVDMSIDLNEVIWSFFSRHRLPGATS